MGKGLHPDCYIELVIEDSYYNMREKVVEHPHILDIAQQAMRDCDIEPELKPIRGGTDGAQLSFMGLPCPNLFTGGYNYHGKHEFVTLEGMEKAVQVIVRIAELTAQRKQQKDAACDAASGLNPNLPFEEPVSAIDQRREHREE